MIIMDNQGLTTYYRHVQENGYLRSYEHAALWSDGVLRTLGLNLDRGTKSALKQALPEELGSSLTAVFWLLHFRDKSLTSVEFQKMVARRSGVSDAQFARMPVTAVFAGLKRMIDSDLSDRVAKTLAPELGDLWQKA